MFRVSQCMFPIKLKYESKKIYTKRNKSQTALVNEWGLEFFINHGESKVAV